MVGVTATVDSTQLARASRQLAGISRGVERASVRAINKVARGQRSDVVRQIAKKTGLKQKEVRKKNTYLKLANYSNLSALLRLRAKAVRLIRFSARQVKRGVSYASSGGRKLLEHAFIATMPRGHKGVFLRRGIKRLPIDEQYGPNPLDAVDVRTIKIKTERDLAREFDTQVRLLVEGANRG